MKADYRLPPIPILGGWAAESSGWWGLQTFDGLGRPVMYCASKRSHERMGHAMGTWGVHRGTVGCSGVAIFANPFGIFRRFHGLVLQGKYGFAAAFAVSMSPLTYLELHMPTARTPLIDPGQVQPHCYAAARRRAEVERHHALEAAFDDVWRGADALWGRLQEEAASRLSRSAQRLQSRLNRRAGGSPCRS